MDTAGRPARERRRATAHTFATLLAERHAGIRVHHPELGPLTHRAYLGLALAVRDLICETLEQEPAPDLRELVPDLVTFVTALFEGAAAAG